MDDRYPRSRAPELKHAAPGRDWLDDTFAKPRSVAVDPRGKRGHDRQSGRHISFETIEGGREGAAPRRRQARFVLGDRTLAGRTIEAGVGEVHDFPRRARR